MRNVICRTVWCINWYEKVRNSFYMFKIYSNGREGCREGAAEEQGKKKDAKKRKRNWFVSFINQWCEIIMVGKNFLRRFLRIQCGTLCQAMLLAEEEERKQRDEEEKRKRIEAHREKKRLEKQASSVFIWCRQKYTGFHLQRDRLLRTLGCNEQFFSQRSYSEKNLTLPSMLKMFCCNKFHVLTSRFS